MKMTLGTGEHCTDMAFDSQRAPRARVIVLTAQHGEIEEKALDLGAHDPLGVPVQTRSLGATARAALRAQALIHPEFPQPGTTRARAAPTAKVAAVAWILPPECKSWREFWSSKTVPTT